MPVKPHVPLHCGDEHWLPCHVQPGPWEPPSIRASRGAALLSTAVFRPLWAGSTHLLLLPVAGESWELHGGRRHGQ